MIHGYKNNSLGGTEMKRNRYMNGQVDVAGLHADQIFFEVWRLLNQIRGTVRGFGNSVGNTHQIFKIYTHLSRARYQHVRQISYCGKMRRDVEEKVNIFLSLSGATRCTRRQFEARSRSSTTRFHRVNRDQPVSCVFIFTRLFISTVVSCHRDWTLPQLLKSIFISISQVI